MNKNKLTRWNDTIRYLNDSFPTAAPRIGDHINTIVSDNPTRESISEQLALGSANRVHKNTDANKNARHALRGLLLCQRIYFSEKWANSNFVGEPVAVPLSALDANWRTLSLNTWGMRSEASILDAIAMFATVPNVSASDVSVVAKLGPPTGLRPAIAGNLEACRSTFEVTGAAETCYRGVLGWLLKSGLVSFRWFMQNAAPTGEASLKALFGDGEVVWTSDQIFVDGSVLPDVEAGYIVHMWNENTGPAGWNGHWVISNGDGTFCGVNNGEVKAGLGRVQVLKNYSNNGTLRSQFEGYGGYEMKEVKGSGGFLTLVEKTPREATKGKMVKFNPLNLPGRM
ncbi:hypothetical protein LNV09_17625 [Paucibacter sp. B2R-40]|uniref:hypothetical protein n=1 Tax=Paucibacter sp. B2R-40 TaxID=2893554 RepID=UPI0021E4A59D|nr:hypothetical protein [Paucibacter sp. B2R-40]MCV2355965.1 hypothetical protein [Paucibacter sp. B2R-40]